MVDRRVLEGRRIQHGLHLRGKAVTLTRPGRDLRAEPRVGRIVGIGALEGSRGDLEGVRAEIAERCIDLLVGGGRARRGRRDPGGRGGRGWSAARRCDRTRWCCRRRSCGHCTWRRRAYGLDELETQWLNATRQKTSLGEAEERYAAVQKVRHGVEAMARRHLRL